MRVRHTPGRDRRLFGEERVAMAVLTFRVTEEGIVIPRAAAGRLGCRPGTWAAIEVHPLPSSEEIIGRALHHILHHLGDAVYVEDPVCVEDGWRLALKVKGRQGTFGHLFLTPDGDVVPSRSTSGEELEEALRAACAQDPSVV
jgi:hypothetical protein